MEMDEYLDHFPWAHEEPWVPKPKELPRRENEDEEGEDD